MSNSFNEFTLDGKPATARAVGVLFGGLLVTLSALTSAAFFYAYAGDAFAFLVGDLSAWLAAAVGVLCYEIASLVWSWLRANDADTAAQLATANIAAWLTMVGGLVVTVVYFGLTTPLIAGQLDATANGALSLAGGMLIVLGIAGNFAAGHVYRVSAATHAQAQQHAELRAMQTGARHVANREATQAELVRTIELIRESLPDTANAQANANTVQYIAERFPSAPRMGQEARAAGRPTPTPNGHA
jgi:hypothetical protein